MKEFIKKIIPRFLRPFAHKLYDHLNFFRKLKERREIRSGERSAMTPPQRLLASTTPHEFEKIGKEFFRYFTELGKIKRTDSILDVGCGQGRMAAPLTGYLNAEGRYEGFDIIPSDIEWCQKKISSKFPNFRFSLADVYNEAYYPGGKFQAADYKFPFEDNSFDFVYLTSVFTHLLPPDMENYFSQISRVLKPGGRCLITFFLLNVGSQKLIDESKSTLDFKYDFPGYKSIHAITTEWAVAFEEDYIKSLFEQNGLRIDQIHYGSWCGRDRFLSYQDMIIGNKK